MSAPSPTASSACASATWLEQCVAQAAGLAILSGLVYNPQTIMATVSKEHLMDLIRESSFAQYRVGALRNIS